MKSQSEQKRGNQIGAAAFQARRGDGDTCVCCVMVTRSHRGTSAVDSSKVNYIFTKELATVDGIQRRSHSTLRDLDSD